MPPKKRGSKKDAQVPLETHVRESQGSAQAVRGAAIHRKAVFSRTTVERGTSAPKHVAHRMVLESTVGEAIEKEQVHRVMEAPVSTELPAIFPAEKEPLPRVSGIIPLSQKDDWLRYTFYILFTILVLYAIYLIVAYGVARTQLIYEYQGDFLQRTIIEEEAVAERQKVEILETSTGFLRVRSGPSTSHNELLKVYSGDVYPLIQTKEGWHEIQLEEGATGWIFAEYAKVLSN